MKELIPEAEREHLPTEGMGALVLVRWIDSSGKTRWADREDVATSKVPEIETVARIVNQTETVLRLASTRDSGTGLMDTNTIPMVNVLEIVPLQIQNHRKRGANEVLKVRRRREIEIIIPRNKDGKVEGYRDAGEEREAAAHDGGRFSAEAGGERDGHRDDGAATEGVRKDTAEEDG